MAVPFQYDHGESSPVTQAVRIAARGDALQGKLTIPTAAHGLVLFASGGGYDMQSSRNHYIAAELHRRQFATLLFDLLTADEERRVVYTGRTRLDDELLSRRLRHAVDWAAEHESTRSLPLGLFGSGTGAAAAVQASADRPTVQAVVCHSGRPDLALESLERVRAAVLFIVDGYDDQTLETNRYAHSRVVRAARRQLVVVFGATHLLETSGTLNDAARAAADWYGECLVPTPAVAVS